MCRWSALDQCPVLVGCVQWRSGEQQRTSVRGLTARVSCAMKCETLFFDQDYFQPAHFTGAKTDLPDTQGEFGTDTRPVDSCLSEIKWGYI